jgi:mannose-6-phosphate isomerase-like protein (cupin superfamily)
VPFRRCNLFELPLTTEIAHDGSGWIDAVRIATREQLAGGCEFIDYAEVPPGRSIGDHRHPADEEEFYLLLSGSGVMRLEDDTVSVTAGDLVRNPAGGLHGMTNTGDEVIRLFVFALTLRAE